MQKLICLCLEGGPAADTVKGTVMAWCETIRRRRALSEEDAPRVREGFLNLMERSTRWPSVADFLEAMPKREAATVTALPVDSQERARRDAAARKALAELGAMLGTDGRIAKSDAL